MGPKILGIQRGKLNETEIPSKKCSKLCIPCEVTLFSFNSEKSSSHDHKQILKQCLMIFLRMERY